MISRTACGVLVVPMGRVKAGTGKTGFDRMRIDHTADRRAAGIERVPLKQDALNRSDTGFKRQGAVRFDIEFPVGMHTSGNVERLAATDFHFTRGIHGKLENGDAGQLQLLQDSPGDVLRAGRILRV